MLNMAVLAPMPIARDTITAAVMPGLFKNERTANFRSRARVSIPGILACEKGMASLSSQKLASFDPSKYNGAGFRAYPVRRRRPYAHELDSPYEGRHDEPCARFVEG